MSAPTVVAAPRHPALSTIGLWLGSSVILATGAYLAAAALSPDTQTPTVAAVFVVYLTMPLAALVVYRRRGLRDRLAVRPAAPGAYGSAAVLWLILLAVGAAVYLAIGAATGSPAGPILDVIHEATDYSRFPTASPADWALIVPRALLLAGITEELLFRGMLFGWLRSRWSWWPTALVSAAAFAAVHGYYPVLLPFAFLLGIGLAWLRERTRSVLPGIGVHILTDVLLFVLALTIP